MTRSKNSRAESSSSQGPVRKTPTSEAPASSKQADLALRPDQRNRRCLGPQQSDRVRIERDGQGGHAGRVGPGAEPAEKPLMAAMNSVEVADRDDGPAGDFGDVARSVNRDHPRRSPLRKSTVSLDQSDSPSWTEAGKEIIIASARRRWSILGGRGGPFWSPAMCTLEPARRFGRRSGSFHGRGGPGRPSSFAASVQRRRASASSGASVLA